MFHERPFIDDALVLHKLGSSVLDFWFGGAVLINSLAAVAAFQNESCCLASTYGHIAQPRA